MNHEFFITIPCEPAKTKLADEAHPVHVFIGNDSTGAARTRWICPYCDLDFERRKPCERHMGLVMNIPAGCTVLRAQDERRRASAKGGRA